MAMTTASPTPRLLKDFLLDQQLPAGTYTRKITRFHKATEVFINAVRFLPFKSITPPSILPRSISRRLSRSRTTNSSHAHTHYHYEIKESVSITVKVKDILRWKSFRDLAEDEIAPPPDAASPSRLTTTTASGTSTNISGRSSWCDSDFTAEDLPSWLGESEPFVSENEMELKSKNCLPVKTVGSKTMTDLEEEMLHEVEESHTPVSVLDFSFRENGKSFSSFGRMSIKTKDPKSQDDIQTRISVEEDEEVNRIEEKANELVNRAQATCPIEGRDTDVDHCLLLDFFRHELTMRKNSNVNDQFESKKLRMAKAWLRGEDDGSLEWEMEGKREVCVSEMERRERWNEFEEQQEEMTVEIEITLLNSLLDELLVDLISH